MGSEEMEQPTNRTENVKRLQAFQHEIGALCTGSNKGSGASSSELSAEDKSLELELYLAATKDDLKSFGIVFERVLRDQTSPSNPFNHARISDNTLLHVATEYGCAHIVRLIAQRFPSLMAKQNSSGDTPFHIATRDGDKSVFKALIEIHTEYIKSLPSNDEESNCNDGALKVQNSEMNTALHEALIYRRKSMAQQLAKHCGKDAALVLNKENKSAVYLAVEAGYKKCVQLLLGVADMKDERWRTKTLNGESVLHAAAKGRNADILKMVTSKLPSLMASDHNINMDMTPLHCAASAGHMEGVHHLLTYNHGLDVTRKDANGLFPIHQASLKGHVDVVQELLKRMHDPSLYLNNEGQNILHLAAESGKCNVINYILKQLGSKKLVNQKDNDGNTALHLASLHWHPHVVSALTWDKRVDVKLLNNKGQTALDVALQNKDGHISLRQRLTWAALKAAKTPIRMIVETSSSNSNQPEKTDMFKDRVNSLLVVATLVATVTFAAGFTMPGGYTSSEPDVGMAVMLKHIKFQIFVFCNTTAMYTATLVVVILMWAQLGDLQIVIVSLEWALPLLGVALTMMCLAYFNGVYIVVSKLNWLANAVLISGCIFLVTIAGLFFSLGLPIESGNRAFRFISYYLISLMLWITNSYSESQEATGAPEAPSRNNLYLYEALRKRPLAMMISARPKDYAENEEASSKTRFRQNLQKFY